MRIDPDDPILTSYALGELDDETRADVEAALAESPEDRQAVLDILQTANALSADFGREPLAILDDEQRQTIAAAIASEPTALAIETAPPGVVAGPWRRTAFFATLAAAACLTLALTLWQFYFKAPGQSARTYTELTPNNKTASGSLAPPQPNPIANANLQTSAPEAAGPEITKFSATQPPNDPGTSFRMSPELMRRYGLIPRQPRSADESSARISVPPTQPYRPSPKSPPQGTDAVSLRARYGLGPSSSEALLPRFPDGGIASTKPAQRPTGMSPELRRRYGLTSVTPATAEQQNQPSGLGTATYPVYHENAFLPVVANPLSTFSVDVDTASYANVRRFLNQGQWPPRDAVRIEEMLNYFAYDYPKPKAKEPFAALIEVAGCPWSPQNRLVRIAVKARDVGQAGRPPGNFVFLIDVSGSMRPPERLPLIKQALRLLARRMTTADRIAIVVYANASGVVLPSTSGAEKEKILDAIDRLDAGGSTNGGEGIQQAYAVAAENLAEGGVNRVILCTDGDFNVGVTDRGELIRLIQEKARSGVFLSALGVGTDNYKDALLQNLADKGNGNYHYLDSMEEAQKVLLEQMNATLVTIAKDVKIQIEFNPFTVNAYRLIGYEKRLLPTEDFDDDTKDAGEVGAGHAVTVLYEIVPASSSVPTVVDKLKYQAPPRPERRTTNASGELLTLKLRYQEPSGGESKLFEMAASDRGASYGKATTDFKFAAAVASFGMILRNSEFKGSANLDTVLELAGEGKGSDGDGYRGEFINLVRRAKELSSKGQPQITQNRPLNWIRRGPKETQEIPQTQGANAGWTVPLTREPLALDPTNSATLGNLQRIVALDAAGEVKGAAQSDKIVVNVANSGGRAFAILRISLKGKGKDLLQRINLNRHRLLDVATGTLSSKTLDEVDKPGFRNLLRSELLALFNQVLGGNALSDVVITEFITQQ